MRIKFSLLYIAFLFIVSCNNDSERRIVKSPFDLFLEFAENKFDFSVGKDSIVNIIVAPHLVCKGCIDEQFRSINKNNLHAKTILITSNPDVIKKLNNVWIKVYYDKNYGLDRLNYDFSNLTLLIVKDRKLVKQITFSPNTADRIGNYIR